MRKGSWFLIGLAIGSLMPRTTPALHVPWWMTVVFGAVPFVALIGWWCFIWRKVRGAQAVQAPDEPV